MWHWLSLSKNTSISLQFIVDTIEDFPWNFKILTNEMPLNIIDKYYMKDWDWRLVSINAKHTDVLKYKKIKWDWLVLSNRPNIVYNLLEDHPGLPWDHKTLSMNNLGIVKRNNEISTIPIAVLQKPSVPIKESESRPTPSCASNPFSNIISRSIPEKEENFVEYAGEL